MDQFVASVATGLGTQPETAPVIPDSGLATAVKGDSTEPMMSEAPESLGQLGAELVRLRVVMDATIDGTQLA